MFKLDISKSSAKIRERESLVAGSVNNYICQFNFSSAWDGLNITAVFEADGVSKSVPLAGETMCKIPWEVLVNPGPNLTVGFSGSNTDGELIVQPTQPTYLGIINAGTKTSDPGSPPTPDQYEQIYNLAMRAQYPQGGLPGQVLAKASSADYDVAWTNQTGGGGSGSPGGYYTPSVSQPVDGKMTVSYTPSDTTMPAVEDVTVELSAGKDGAPGRDAPQIDDAKPLLTNPYSGAKTQRLFDDLWGEIGDKTQLQTVEKSSLVAAINELANSVGGSSDSGENWEFVKDITAGQEITGNWIILNNNAGIKIKKFLILVKMYKPTEEGHVLSYANAQLHQPKARENGIYIFHSFNCVPKGNFHCFMCFGEPNGNTFSGENQYQNNSQASIYGTITIFNNMANKRLSGIDFETINLLSNFNIYFGESYCGADTRVIIAGVREDESV